MPVGKVRRPPVKGLPWRGFPAFMFLLAPILPGLAAEDVPPRGFGAYAAEAPRIDGRLDEPVWSTATPLDGPGGTTRFLWNETGVFVAFRGIEKSPVMGSASVGESLHQEDVFELFLDQKGDHRQFYEIQVDPEGRLFLFCHVLTAEPRLTAEGRLTQEFVESDLWRYGIPVPDGFRHASRLDRESGEWTLEIFLPAHFAHRRAGGVPMRPATWRIHLVRNDWDKPKSAGERKIVTASWAPVLDFHAHISPTRMGWLEMKPASFQRPADSE